MQKGRALEQGEDSTVGGKNWKLIPMAFWKIEDDMLKRILDESSESLFTEGKSFYRQEKAKRDLAKSLLEVKRKSVETDKQNS